MPTLPCWISLLLNLTVDIQLPAADIRLLPLHPAMTVHDLFSCQRSADLCLVVPKRLDMGPKHRHTEVR